MKVNVKEKLLMLKIREIIVNELNNVYYKNTANIKDKEFLVNEKLYLDGENIKHQLSLVKYLNTYYYLEEKYYQVNTLSEFGINITEYNKEYARENAKELVYKNNKKD